MNYVIIIGVHRSGTSTLFDYLKSYPAITPSRKKELHFFTPLRFGLAMDKALTYKGQFLKPQAGAKYFMEASPSYFYGGKKVYDEILKQTNDETKFILLLRNPIDRLISFYNHCNYLGRITDLSLSEFIQTSLKASKQPIQDTIFSRAIREGYYVDDLKEWEDRFGDRLKVLFYEEVFNDEGNALKQLVKWLEIDDKNSTVEVPLSNESRQYKNRSFHMTAVRLNKLLSEPLMRKSRAKQNFKKWYNAINTSGLSDQSYSAERRELDEIYRQKNLALKQYLLNSKPHRALPKWLADLS